MRGTEHIKICLKKLPCVVLFIWQKTDTSIIPFEWDNDLEGNSSSFKETSTGMRQRTAVGWIVRAFGPGVSDPEEQGSHSEQDQQSQLQPQRQLSDLNPKPSTGCAPSRSGPGRLWRSAMPLQLETSLEGKIEHHFQYQKVKVLKPIFLKPLEKTWVC